MSLRLTLILSWLLLASSAQATVRCVNNTASCPGSGTSGSPYCTIQNAINAASAGDDIRVENSGTSYNENAEVFAGSFGVNGTSGSPITLEGADSSCNAITVTGQANLDTLQYSTTPPNWRCVGNGQEFPAGGICIGGASNGTDGFGHALTFRTSSYWIVKNLRFDGSDIVPTTNWTGGFYIRNWNASTNIQILNNTFANWGGSASQQATGCSGSCESMAIDGGTGWIVQNNRFVGGRYRGLDSLGPAAGAETVKFNEFTGLTCGYNSGGNDTETIGIHSFIGSVSAVNADVIANRFHDFSAQSGCNSFCTASTCSFQQESAIWLDGGSSNNTIEANLIYNIDLANIVFGDGMLIEDQTESNIIKNNIIYNTAIGLINSNCDGGSCVGGVTDYNYFYNNTVYNTTGVGLWHKNGWATWENNISSSSVPSIEIDASVISEGSHYVLDDNDYWPVTSTNVGQYNGGSNTAFATWKTNCSCDAHSINVDPLFASVTGHNYRLQSSSPAIDAGTNTGVTADYNGITRPQSLGFDMGAFEFWRAGSFGIR